MIKIEKKENYYLFINSEKRYIYFENLELLLLYISKRNSSFIKYYNSILDNFSMNNNDYYYEQKRTYIYDKENNVYNIIYFYKKMLKEYSILDNDLRIIDIRIYKDKIFDKNYINILEKKYKHNIKKINYRFRKDPVPKIYKFPKKYASFPKMMNEIRQSLDRDEKKYIKMKKISKKINRYKNIWYYDEIIRNKPLKSWKSQSKKKKQWM